MSEGVCFFLPDALRMDDATSTMKATVGIPVRIYSFIENSCAPRAICLLLVVGFFFVDALH